MKKYIKTINVDRLPALLIKMGMPVITLAFLYILNSVLAVPENEKAWLYAEVYTMLEYAVMSFTLLFCGSFLSDMALRNGQ